MSGGYVIIEAVPSILSYLTLIFFLIFIALSGYLVGILVRTFFFTRWCRKKHDFVDKTNCFNCENYIEDLEECWWKC